ncbi:uncharacterized protein LOC107365125 [Tetranychus urticae]|uniref:uncharacterized protein LOC107365125 n=1 Tax=Tetranychus urticae TaxID=32264 RepID=UPI00077BCAD0|nr:uncharacterized protein LOC107365125 [Tetranychus urticae]
MVYKLFLLSIVFLSMLINDNNCVQAQRPFERFCRTTGCDNRTLQQVTDQCRRAYGSSIIRPESCGGGLTRYRCCESCLDIPCSSEPSRSVILDLCAREFGELNPGIQFGEISVSGNSCGIGVWTYQCCLRNL